MKNRTLHAKLACSLPFLLLACSSRPDEPESRPQGTGTLVVIVDGFESREGSAWIALYLGPEGFPDEGKKAHLYRKVAVDSESLRIVFEDVPAGSFAVSAFHDVNENEELDTDVLGIPSERWGVSKDAGGFLGPPSYESARLELAPGSTLEVRFPIG